MTTAPELTSAPESLEQALVTARAVERPTAGPPWRVRVYPAPEDGDVFAVVLHNLGPRSCGVGFRLSPVADVPGPTQWSWTALVVQEVESDRRFGMTRELLRSLPLAAMLAAAREAADAAATPRRRRDEPLDSSALDALLRPWREEHRGIRRSDRDYAALAVAYAMLVRAGDRQPGVTLAARLGQSSPRTMLNRIGEARRRGLLTPGRPGEAAGTATSKARRLLRREE